MFWKIARSYTLAEYAENLKSMKRYNPGAYESLSRQVPSTWSRPFFKHSSGCNDVLKNLSESFNTTVRECRREPILDMLETIRRRIMDRNYKRYLMTMRYITEYNPKIYDEIERNRLNARECTRITTNDDFHEVDQNGDSYTVNLVARTCGCGYWQLNGIPCMHLMCVITTLKLPLLQNFIVAEAKHTWY